jgi:hypothetical protein
MLGIDCAQDPDLLQLDKSTLFAPGGVLFPALAKKTQVWASYHAGSDAPRLDGSGTVVKHKFCPMNSAAVGAAGQGRFGFTVAAFLTDRSLRYLAIDRPEAGALSTADHGRIIMRYCFQRVRKS